MLKFVGVLKSLDWFEDRSWEKKKFDFGIFLLMWWNATRYKKNNILENPNFIKNGVDKNTRIFRFKQYTINKIQKLNDLVIGTPSD